MKWERWKSLAYAVAFFAGWVGTHVYAVFWFDWRDPGAGVIAPALFLAKVWLNVALFIVAHDCIHGSFWPGAPVVNRWTGGAALLLYAGFPFRKIAEAHHAHHFAPGGPDDPDFHGARADHWPWFLRFVARYFGWREFAVMAGVAFAQVALGAEPLKVAAFWAAPAMLSALQLFYFGTYLPHRPGAAPFADRHNARSHHWAPALSYLSCLNFGLHHEHHLYPGAPWWKLGKIAQAQRPGLVNSPSRRAAEGAGANTSPSAKAVSESLRAAETRARRS